MEGNYIGMLSAKYESNGDAGCIANNAGDAGGKSVGIYQFANTQGTIRSFINWLRNKEHKFGYLAEYDTDTDEFDIEWKRCAELDETEFEKVQHDYIKEFYYDVAVRLLRNVYINMEKHSFALKNVVWSAAVQHGVGNIEELFETVCEIMGYDNCSYIDDKSFDEQIIKIIYGIRSSDVWTSGSPSLRYGMRRRFDNEREDALELLRNEIE